MPRLVSETGVTGNHPEQFHLSNFRNNILSLIQNLIYLVIFYFIKLISLKHITSFSSPQFYLCNILIRWISMREYN